MRHHRTLGIVAPMRTDTHHRAQRRLRAIRGHDQAGGNDVSIGQVQLGPIVARRIRDHLGGNDTAHPGIVQRVPERRLHEPVLDDVAEHVTSFIGRVETDRGAVLRIPYDHAFIGRRTRGLDGCPYSQRIEQADGRRGEPHHAQVHFVGGGPGSGFACIDQRHRETGASRGQRRRRADHATAHHGHVEEASVAPAR